MVFWCGFGMVSVRLRVPEKVKDEKLRSGGEDNSGCRT